MSDHHSDHAPAPKPEPKKGDITPFAATNFHNARRVFGIKKEDRRRHVYVIGKTGMGKSTLLENLVFADIHSGNGACYVDPHGDTAEQILQWIPTHRIKDTIYFNPADRMHPIAFNVLERVERVYRDNIASGLISVYKKLWADSWGPRLEYILRYTLLALLDAPDSTLLGVNRMLVDKPYLQHVLRFVEDPVVRSFWNDEFSKWNERNLAEVISPIQNKVGQFISNSMIRNIVGQQESTISMRKIMDEKKVLILNLSKGHMGEDASALLGAMLITKMQLAAMSRVDIPEDDRIDFFLYVDEFQNFVTESFANILSEARKYRLCLTIAHQYIAQLNVGQNTVVRDAVFGNVGTVIAFRVGATDAEFLEKEFTPQFLIEDLINLPQYKIYLRLMVNGVSSDPFSADTLPPLSSRDFGNGDAVIDFTRLHYTRSREEVMNTINAWAIKDYSNEQFDTTGGAAGATGGFHAGPTPAQAYAAEQKKRFEMKEEKPIVWHGNCDACGKELNLSFVPDESRPILCQDDLKLFRKGGLPGPTVEKMMMKVMERKAALTQKTQKAAEPPKPIISPKPASTPRPAPVVRPASPRSASTNKPAGERKFEHKKPTDRKPIDRKPQPAPAAKGTIRLVNEFTDEPKTADEKPAVIENKGKVVIDPAILAALKIKEEARTVAQKPQKEEIESTKAPEAPKPAQPPQPAPKVQPAPPAKPEDLGLPKPKTLTPGKKIEF